MTVPISVFFFRFIAKVFIDNKFVCEKTGKSKKIAKMNAVNEAIEQLDIEGQVFTIAQTSMAQTS